MPLVTPLPTDHAPEIAEAAPCVATPRGRAAGLHGDAR